MRTRNEQCPKCAAIGRDTRGDNLVRYSDGGAHCFSCGYHIFPKGHRPRIENINAPKNLLPSDFTREVPSRAWQWLVQYGLPISYWAQSTGYSEEKGKRLVFRVPFDISSPMAFSIGRYIGEETGHRKWYVWGDCHKHCEVIGTGPTVVLVEDLVSAHKVGNVAKAIPLFGTAVHPCHLYYLNNTDISNIILWLDKDQEYNVRKLALRLESLVNKPIKVVCTREDPKCLSLQNIQMAIESC